jgi:putative transposase
VTRRAAIPPREVPDNAALTRGMQGLCIRLAKALNTLLERRGPIFADHYHSHLLLTPTEVARALAYVRTNAEKHYGERGVDYFSSDHAGWKELLADACSWLLTDGWRRAR